MTQRDISPAADETIHDEFQRSVDPYRYELLVHCYRMLGSLEDAEDALQETWLRAWQHLDSLKTQTSLRAWLYKIATNVSLDLLDQRKRRSMPNLTHANLDPTDPLPGPIDEPIWLEPLPDSYLDELSLDPEARYEITESVSLAFLTALQTLPGRQRAALLLCDVLNWKSQDAANVLDLSVAAINSALQRARSTMKKHQHDRPFHTLRLVDDPQTKTLLARYVQAWETADSVSLINLLREDVIMTMPPLPAWYRGQAAIKAFLDRHLLSGSAPDQFRVVTTRANGCPACAIYNLDHSSVYRPGGLHVLTLDRDRIAQIDDFLTFDGRLFERFKLPLIG
jgi:RNA polymerase sigma-70 factor (ECF subfamily)